MIEVTAGTAERITRDYLCANCWGRVYAQPTDKKTKSGSLIVKVHCSTDGCECQGFVSKSWVERRQQEGRNERAIVYENLKDHLDWVRKKGPDSRYEDRWDPERERPERSDQSNEDILKNLGF